MEVNDPQAIKRILDECRTIAVVGSGQTHLNFFKIGGVGPL